MSQGQADKNGDIVLVALGGNVASEMGSARETVEGGLAALRSVFDPLNVSRFYRTPAFPPGSGPDFLNAACAFHSTLDAAAILTILHDIEASFGRTRTLRWGQRTLDLDLIACGQEVLPDLATFGRWRDLPLEAQKTNTPDQLILPHPRLQDRPFVLIPLADVASEWRHPVSGRSVSEMVATFSQDERAEITPLP